MDGKRNFERVTWSKQKLYFITNCGKTVNISNVGPPPPEKRYTPNRKLVRVKEREDIERKREQTRSRSNLPYIGRAQGG